LAFGLIARRLGRCDAATTNGKRWFTPLLAALGRSISAREGGGALLTLGRAGWRRSGRRRSWVRKAASFLDRRFFYHFGKSGKPRAFPRMRPASNRPLMAAAARLA